MGKGSIVNLMEYIEMAHPDLTVKKLQSFYDQEVTFLIEGRMDKIHDTTAQWTTSPPGIAVLKEFTTARINKVALKPTLSPKEISAFAASDNTDWPLMQEVGEMGWTQD